MARILSLDTIQNAADRYLYTWSTRLESNQAGKLFRYITTCLWQDSKGHLTNAQLTLAQTTISQRLGISRQWIGKLADRLAKAGWLIHGSVREGAMNTSSVWALGPMFKKLLIMLQKSRQGREDEKSPTKPDDNNPLHLVPSSEECKQNPKGPPPQLHSDGASRTEDRRRERQERLLEEARGEEVTLPPDIQSLGLFAQAEYCRGLVRKAAKNG